MGAAVGRIGWVQVDCADPVGLSGFWSELLGTPVRGTLGDPPQYVILEAPSPGGVRLAFQRVAEPKAGKNRLHLDVMVADLDVATELAVALGATPVDDVREHGYTWRVLRDPAGNEFCLVPE